MKTTIREITPQWASKVLETRNPRNRPVSQATVNSYAADMRAGHWILTHQGIAFNESGDLLDGQHRLLAVIQAGVPTRMVVTSDLPSSQDNGLTLATMDVIDRHRLRGIGQQLSLSHGWANGNRVAGTVRGMALFYASDKGNCKVTTAQTLAILELCGASVRAVMKSAALSAARANSKLLAACAIYHTKHPNKSIEFLESYLTTIGWTKGCPQKAYEVWRTHNPTEMSAGRATAVEAAAVALYYHHRGESVQIIRVNQAATSWLSGLNPELRAAIKKEISK